jgi:hypothetical protein
MVQATSMERAIEIFAAVQFAAIGLSHVLQPRAWAEFFLWLRERGDAGVFVVAFLSLWFGSIVVAFHNVWSGIPVLLTIIGWAQMIKGIVYFAAPSFAMRRMQLVSIERAWVFIPPGVVFLVLAGLLGWNLWQTA